MKTAAKYVTSYLWNFINQLSIGSPNSAVADNCRRAAEKMVDAAVAEALSAEAQRCAYPACRSVAVAEERARCVAIAMESARLGDEDGNPDVVAAARIIARKIERGD